MRTTVTVDDELFEKALDLVGPSTSKAELFREALKVFVQVQTAKRLSAQGGGAPQMENIPRTRSSSS